MADNAGYNARPGVIIREAVPERDEARQADTRLREISNPQCSFCSKLPEMVKKLVAGPKVFICSDCVALAVAANADTRKEFPEPRARQVCSFCGKQHDKVKRLIAGPGVFICNECVELAAQACTE